LGALLYGRKEIAYRTKKWVVYVVVVANVLLASRRESDNIKRKGVYNA
jgi:hypothetical protein